MSAMEFEELRLVWNTQQNEPLYVIDKQGLHNRIISKKKTGIHIAHFAEILLISVNTIAGVINLVLNLTGKGNYLLYLLSLWMFMTVAYVISWRTKRQKASQQFDQSMLGDLRHAVSMATYQVRLSLIMRWNILPVACFVLVAMIDEEKAGWMTALILAVFIIAHFAGGVEHRFYVRRKKELEKLLGKLESEQ